MFSEHEAKFLLKIFPEFYNFVLLIILLVFMPAFCNQLYPRLLAWACIILSSG